MEDYYFLLIAIALSIFGAVRKNRKKTDTDHPFARKTERPRNFFMDQLLGEDFLEKPEKEVNPAPLVKPILKKEPLISNPALRPEGQFQTRFKSTLPDRPKKTLQRSILKSEVEEVGEVEDFENLPDYLEDFSLRKAFVYSEIMGRKY